MFITINNATQYVSTFGGIMLLANPNAREATVREAGECVSNLILTNDHRMGDANLEYELTYGLDNAIICQNLHASRSVINEGDL